jgi:hypothetical protein
VADKHQRPGAPHIEVVGQPADYLDVEMIGPAHRAPPRRGAPAVLGQRHPAPFASRQPGHVGIEIDAGQQVRYDVTRVGLGGPDMVRLPPTMTSRTGGAKELVTLPQIAHR